MPVAEVDQDVDLSTYKPIPRQAAPRPAAESTSPRAQDIDTDVDLSTYKPIIPAAPVPPASQRVSSSVSVPPARPAPQTSFDSNPTLQNVMAPPWELMKAKPPMVTPPPPPLYKPPTTTQRPADLSKMTSSAFVYPQKAVPQNAAEELQQNLAGPGKPQLVPSAPVVARPHTQASVSAAPEPGKLEQAREFVVNSTPGEELQRLAPGVSRALHLEPTETDAGRIARNSTIDLHYHPIEGLKHIDAGMRVVTDQDYADAWAKVSAKYPDLDSDGVVRVLAGKGIRPRSFDEREGGAHEAIGGAMETFGKPVIATSAMANPVVTAQVLAFGTIGQLVATKAAETVGASPNTVALAGDVGAILSAGVGAKVKGYTGAYREKGVKVGAGPVEARVGYRPAYRAPGPEGSYIP